jgi:hypothetical protein
MPVSPTACLTAFPVGITVRALALVPQIYFVFGLSPYDSFPFDRRFRLFARRKIAFCFENGVVLFEKAFGHVLNGLGQGDRFFELLGK